MALNSTVTNLVTAIERDLAEGRGSRQTIGGPAAAFSWLGAGVPVTVANFVAKAQTEGMSVPTVTVSPSGIPGVVAENGPKPTLATIATGTIGIKKFAGTASVSTEQVLGSTGITAAVQSTLYAQALQAFEADAIASIDAAATDTATGADLLGAIAAGQAAILSAGGAPGLVIISAADYATIIGLLGSSAGYAADPGSAVGSLYGSLIHVSPALAAGKVFVADPSAILATEHVSSPLVVVDPFSGSGTNVVKINSEIFAATTVTAPGLVCECSVGAARAATTKKH